MQKNALIIGAGKLGLSLHCALRNNPYFKEPRLVGRSNAWSNFLEAEHIHLSNLDIALESPPDYLFICTQDNEIVSVCQHLSVYGKRLHTTLIIHCSGAVSLEPLGILAAYGCKIGSMHPVKAFPAPIGQQAFHNCPMAIEGDDTVAKLLEQLAEQLGAQPFRLHSGAKAKYHAAACVASNYLVTLAHISTSLFEEAGLSLSQSRALTKTLMHTSLEHISAEPDYHQALSGPIQRGDTNTVAKHRAILSDSVYANVYAELGRLSLALTKHPAEKEGELEEILRN